jgi:hypothetical protein
MSAASGDKRKPYATRPSQNVPVKLIRIASQLGWMRMWSITPVWHTADVEAAAPAHALSRDWGSVGSSDP